MNKELIDIKTIIYSPLNKDYKILFNSMESGKEFYIYLTNKYAKNIAMASEGIASESLSTFDLFINLLSQRTIP